MILEILHRFACSYPHIQHSAIQVEFELHLVYAISMGDEDQLKKHALLWQHDACNKE